MGTNDLQCMFCVYNWDNAGVGRTELIKVGAYIRSFRIHGIHSISSYIYIQKKVTIQFSRGKTYRKVWKCEA